MAKPYLHQLVKASCPGTKYVAYTENMGVHDRVELIHAAMWFTRGNGHSYRLYVLALAILDSRAL